MSEDTRGLGSIEGAIKDIANGKIVIRNIFEVRPSTFEMHKPASRCANRYPFEIASRGALRLQSISE